MKIGFEQLKQLGLAAVLAGTIAGCGDGESTTGAGRGSDARSGGGSGTGSSAPQGDTIKIGMIASLSGDTKPWGDDQKRGCEMAVSEFNEAGGLNGKKVELVIQDSASKPASSQEAAQKVLGENVVAIVGEVSSGNTISIKNAAMPKGVPVVAVGATRTDLTKDANGLVSRVCYTDAFQGPVMAAFAVKELNLKKIAVVTDNALPYSQGLSESFIAKVKELGGTVVKEFSYESGKQAPVYSSQITELKTLNVDGVFCSGYFTEVGPFIKQARAAGISAKFMGGDGWDSKTLIDLGGDAVYGSYFCNHYNSGEKSPEVAAFLTNWKAKNGGKLPSTTMGALGYDAMKLTLDALKRAKEVTAAGLKEAIANTEGFKGVSGEITLKGRNGDPEKRAVIVEVTRPDAEGNWQTFSVALTPADLK